MLVVLLALMVACVFIGLAYLGVSKTARTEKEKQNLTEWGYTFIGGSMFPFLIILMCIL